MLTVIDEEFDAAQEALAADTYLDAGYFADSADAHPDVVLAKIGEMGNVSSTGFTKQVIEEFRPEVLILCGIAGGAVSANGTARQGIALGDVFLPHFLHYGDLRKLDAAKGDQKRYNPHDHPSHRLLQTAAACKSRSPRWFDDIAVSAPERKPEVKVVSQGTLVSGEKVFGDRTHPEQRRLIAEYPEAVAVEMEAFGVARGCYEARSAVDYNPGFLVVRGISDLVNAASDAEGNSAASDPQVENQEQRDEWRAYAAAAAATYTAHCARAVLAAPDRRSALRRMR